MTRLWMSIPVCVLLAACQRQPEATAAGSGPLVPTPPYKTTATVKDIMLHVVDPAGDLIWDAVSTTIDVKGVHDVQPRTDEDWARVRSGVITLIEASNLLMMPGRHVARPGEKSETPGIELEPSEMEALIEKDRASWNKHATALHDIAVKTLEVVDRKDVKGLFEIGEPIDQACENCHRQYWYPNEPVQPFTNEPDPKPAK